MASVDHLIQSGLLGEAVDNGPALVFVADETMRYVAVNRKACEVLGYTRAELLALSVTEVARDPSAIEEYADMVAHSTRSGVAILTRRDGGKLVYRYEAGATVVAGLPFYVSVGFVD